jgi:exodeoxyribonuclease V beta subunit
LTLRQIGLRDRLRELDFEIPLAGGDVRGAVPNVSVSDVGQLLRAHLPAGDPVAPYADRLTSAALRNQSLAHEQIQHPSEMQCRVIIRHLPPQKTM